MRILSLQQFIQQASEPQDDTILMTLRDFVDALNLLDAQKTDQERIVEIREDCPEPGTLQCGWWYESRKRRQRNEPPPVPGDRQGGEMIQNASADCPDAPTDQRESRVTHFVWSMAELKEDLANWADKYKIQITMNDEGEPGTVWMVFRKDDSGD